MSILVLLLLSVFQKVFKAKILVHEKGWTSLATSMRIGSIGLAQFLRIAVCCFVAFFRQIIVTSQEVVATEFPNERGGFKRRSFRRWMDSTLPILSAQINGLIQTRLNLVPVVAVSFFQKYLIRVKARAFWTSPLT